MPLHYLGKRETPKLRLTSVSFLGHSATDLLSNLHDVGASVATQLTEAVVTEDDRLVLDLRVRDHEVAICNRQSSTYMYMHRANNICGRMGDKPTGRLRHALAVA